VPSRHRRLIKVAERSLTTKAGRHKSRAAFISPLRIPSAIGRDLALYQKAMDGRAEANWGIVPFGGQHVQRSGSPESRFLIDPLFDPHRVGLSRMFGCAVELWRLSTNQPPASSVPLAAPHTAYAVDDVREASGTSKA
jgi:hypothetical protein